jgi:hypothetical protein
VETALRSLKEHADKARNRYPFGAHVISFHFRCI